MALRQIEINSRDSWSNNGPTLRVLPELNGEGNNIFGQLRSNLCA
jgi:hypothetical protein